jgi:hypothetical protein
LDAELQAQTVREVFLVRIDNWFDNKWLGFGSNFFMGGGTVVPERAPVVFRSLAFPPFTPGRVLAEHHFVQSDSGQFALAEEARLIHDLRRTRRAKSSERGILDFSPSALFAWFGSKSRANGRGSLMVYRAAREGLNGWYASFDGHRDWQPSRTKGIAPTVLKTWMQDLT